MKRILYIHHGGGIGGAPLSLLYLLRQLDQDRYEPIVVTLRDGPVVGLYWAEGIETHVAQGIDDFSHTTLEWYGGKMLWRLPGKLLRVPGSIRGTRDLIRRFQPDLVHLNSSTLAPCAIGAGREGIPIVWHIREPLAKGMLGLRRAWIQQVIDRRAARVVAICQNDADQLISSERIRVIYNFVHFDQFDRSLTGEGFRADLGIPADAPIVLMLGGVSKPKGTLTLIRALPDLVRHQPGIRVVIAGPAPRRLNEGGLKGMAKRVLRVDAYQQAVQQAIEELNPVVRSALIFTGIRTDVPDMLAASQCLVFPSSVPHFARPIIEAAAMAVPAVASDLGGPRELIENGDTGWLVPADNPAALADAIETLLSDPEAAKQMGEAAYRRARERFDAKRNGAATIALYDEILGGS